MSSFSPRTSSYDLHPAITVPPAHAGAAWAGWASLGAELSRALEKLGLSRPLIAVECYPGVHHGGVLDELSRALGAALTVDSHEAFKSSAEIEALVAPDLGGSDPVFGRYTRLNLEDFLDETRKVVIFRKIEAESSGPVLVVGPAAALIVPEPDLFIYADMPRWEGQLRQRRNEVSNLGTENREFPATLQYKRSFFIDWRVCDRLKQKTMARWDYLLDTTSPREPKLAAAAAVRAALAHAVSTPFRVVPFFDPGIWGGQWMKQRFGLDPAPVNYAWGFDCVPEENSLLLGFANGVRVEIPSQNLVYAHPSPLLGEPVYGRFGPEFPIRFDFLDTMGGGNLSFQVHPLTAYAQEHFGLHYTQDESYYMLDAGPGAAVYLGCKDGTQAEEMIEDLRAAQRGEKAFDAEKFAGRFPAKKHDHFLIPAGTLHCSGAGSMVLEISATPYIFTFKLWDWGRLGLDGKPRPINVERGKEVICWERDEIWASQHLVNRIEEVARGEGWREEKTGLYRSQFLETRRHWFTGTVPHHTRGESVHVLNLVEGKEAVVESPEDAFPPFIVHYAETFIVPAAVGAYTIRPCGESAGSLCATMKAYVRTQG